MSVKNVIKKLLSVAGIRKQTDYGSIEYLRSRGVIIGENVHLYNTTIDWGHGFLVSIGNNVTLTGVTILAHDASTQIPFGVSKVGRVNIGDDVFVGHGTIILPGVLIGNQVIIGAGSVVTKSIPDGTVVAGNPARVIGTYEEFLEKHQFKMQQRPIYHTYWADKSDEEKALMQKELQDGIGYDL